VEIPKAIASLNCKRGLYECQWYGETNFSCADIQEFAHIARKYYVPNLKSVLLKETMKIWSWKYKSTTVIQENLDSHVLFLNKDLSNRRCDPFCNSTHFTR